MVFIWRSISWDNFRITFGSINFFIYHDDDDGRLSKPCRIFLLTSVIAVIRAKSISSFIHLLYMDITNAMPSSLSHPTGWPCSCPRSDWVFPLDGQQTNQNKNQMYLWIWKERKDENKQNQWTEILVDKNYLM